jgi:hypothetical protein
MAALLKPPSSFNKTHSLDGLVFMCDANGNIRRGHRQTLASEMLIGRIDLANQRAQKTWDTQDRGVVAALKRAKRINPTGQAELDSLRAQRQLMLGSIGDE